MLRYLRCAKCGWTTYAPPGKFRDNLVCGAVVEYVPADDPTVGNEGIEQSLGMMPLGCGGELKEITQQEALERFQK